MTATDIVLEAPTARVRRDHAGMFAAHHAYDHTFFLALVAMMWLGILMGFVPDIVRHIEHPKLTYPWIVHVHAVVFVGWLCLLTTQVLLVRSRHVGLHRKLGKFGLAHAVLVPVVGAATAIVMDRLALQMNPAFKPTFVSVQLGDLVLFSILTGSAFAVRKQAAAHKRLMLLGTLCIVDAGFSRWWGPGLSRAFGHGYAAHELVYFLGNVVLILALGAYDLMTRGRLHRAYAYGASLAIGGELLMVWLKLSPWWVPVSFRLIGH